MSVEEFRDRDADYLGWVTEHRDGYVINIGRSGQGYARLHRATCGTITSRPPLTGPYIKVCSTALTELEQWTLQRSGVIPDAAGHASRGTRPWASMLEQLSPPPSARADHVSATHAGSRPRMGDRRTWR